jgi:hypothetical protein
MAIDAAYTINVVKTTKIPNLGTASDETKNQIMHAKYNAMHESRMMVETAVMLLPVATSIINLMKNPVTGKYLSVANTADDG